MYILSRMLKKDSLTPVVYEQGDLVFALKPSKLTSHQSTPLLIGFKEYLEAQMQRPLWLVHRLDVGTSGVMVFAQNKETAQILARLFEQGAVDKKYYFIYRGPRPAWTQTQEHQRVESTDDPTKGKSATLAVTKIYYVASASEQDHLFCALPLTGKTHQIRKHAAQIHIPLLGDTLYGKEPFPRLMLFAQEISFELRSKTIQFQNPFLSFSSSSSWQKLLNPFFLSYLDRQYLFGTDNKNACYRLTHQSNFPIRIDRFGQKMVCYNYAEQKNPAQMKDLTQFAKWMMEIEKIQMLPVISMINRGAAPNKQPVEPTELLAPNIWTVEENNLQISMRTDRGLSYGIFLDQRENRQFIQTNSKGKNVLNLFAYTGVFSVAAALGEAKSVCTVDVSPTFIQWSKENFELNHIRPDNHEFWIQESLLFLKSCQKRKRLFDIIICDPPSIGRSKDQVFRIDKDWQTLLNLCETVLAKNGMILFSNNYEKWSYKMWFQKIRVWNKYHFSIHLGLRAPDYEAFHLNPTMKSFFMTRGNHGMNIPPHCKITNDADLMGIKQINHIL